MYIDLIFWPGLRSSQLARLKLLNFLSFLPYIFRFGTQVRDYYIVFTDGFTSEGIVVNIRSSKFSPAIGVLWTCVKWKLLAMSAKDCWTRWSGLLLCPV